MDYPWLPGSAVTNYSAGPTGSTSGKRQGDASPGQGFWVRISKCEDLCPMKIEEWSLCFGKQVPG